MAIENKIIRQPKGSQLCGPACLAMAMEMLGYNVSLKQVAKSLTISKDFGIGLFDLATYPAKQGFQVDLYAWDAQHFPLRWRKMDSEQLIADLERQSLKKGGWRAGLLAGLKMGSRFFPKPISTREMEKRLADGQQMILYVDSAVLFEHADGVWGHYVILHKTGRNMWTILDPHWKYGGLRRYQKDLLLFAFYRLGGYCLFLSKKKARSRR